MEGSCGYEFYRIFESIMMYTDFSGDKCATADVFEIEIASALVSNVKVLSVKFVMCVIT